MAEAAPTEFDEFVDARYPSLVRMAYLLTRDNGTAEDLVQTALAKSWPKWRRIEHDPEAYVRRVMVNTYATWWRRRWRNEHPTEELPDGTDARSGNSVDDRTDLWRALGELTPRQRAVIVLRFYEDQTETQAADVLGCSVGTVKSQTSKALARLRIDDALGSGRSRSRALSDGQGERSTNAPTRWTPRAGRPPTSRCEHASVAGRGSGPRVPWRRPSLPLAPARWCRIS